MEDYLYPRQLGSLSLVAGLRAPGVGGLLQDPLFRLVLSWPGLRLSWFVCLGKEREDLLACGSLLLEGDLEILALRLFIMFPLLGDIVWDLGLAFLPRLAV